MSIKDIFVRRYMLDNIELILKNTMINHTIDQFYIKRSQNIPQKTNEEDLSIKLSKTPKNVHSCDADQKVLMGTTL